MNTSLTALETKVLAALQANAQDVSGGDFAIMEELNVRHLGIDRHQL